MLNVIMLSVVMLSVTQSAEFRVLFIVMLNVTFYSSLF
jgi:hypothetical protein